MAKQKQNSITSSTFPNSTPRLTRSSINHSAILHLSSADTISRCTIDSSKIARNDPKGHPDPGRLALKRSKISTSTLSNTSLTKSDVERSMLSNVPFARSVDVKGSTIENTSRLRRVTVTNSTVSDQSAMARSQVKDSVVIASALSRASVEKSRVTGSRARKSTLKNCQVTDCEIVNTDFQGMVLRNGIWRNGRLIGCFHAGEADVVVNGQKMAIPKSEKCPPSERWQGVSESESSDCLNSESDVDDDDGRVEVEQKNEKDLPPPYTP
ncbi:hypothetical protein BDV18DRAFT_162153 [Aspergillus unguis]